MSKKPNSNHLFVFSQQRISITNVLQFMRWSSRLQLSRDMHRRSLWMLYRGHCWLDCLALYRHSCKFFTCNMVYGLLSSLCGMLIILSIMHATVSVFQALFSSDWKWGWCLGYKNDDGKWLAVDGIWPWCVFLWIRRKHYKRWSRWHINTNVYRVEMVRSSIWKCIWEARRVLDSICKVSLSACNLIYQLK